jgi:hypothetical protein
MILKFVIIVAIGISMNKKYAKTLSNINLTKIDLIIYEADIIYLVQSDESVPLLNLMKSRGK